MLGLPKRIVFYMKPYSIGLRIMSLQLKHYPSTIENRAIKTVEFISGNNSINWAQTDGALVISAKGEKPCKVACVFKIRFETD